MSLIGDMVSRGRVGQGLHEPVISHILMVKISINIPEKKICNQSGCYFQSEQFPKYATQLRECAWRVCCVSVCVVDKEGSCVFASRALEVAATAVDLTSYSDWFP